MPEAGNPNEQNETGSPEGINDTGVPQWQTDQPEHQHDCQDHPQFQ
jgi:hypothetical protein